uniref:Uncharacterized protein n=1 Tax=Cacopsylla melanoneura TaxID=428564 RepID=A0A8D8W9K2_9HEMI
MKRLIFGLLVLVALSSAKVIKSDAIVFPDEEFESHHKPLLDLDDTFTRDKAYFSEPRFRGPAHVRPLSLNAEPLDFNMIQQRYKQLRHNIVKRSPGFKSKGSSKSKGSGSGYFSSKAKGGNKGQDHNNGYNSNGYNNNKHQQQHASAPQQPAYNPGYGHPAPPPSYGHAPPSYGHPAPAYGQPAYGQPAYHPAPAYHPPAPQQPTVVVVHGAGGSSGGGGGGYAPSKGPGLGTALATGLASGVGSGVGFGVANAAINGITGGGNRHPAYPESRPAPPPQNNDNSGNSGSSNNNNNNNNQNNNFNNNNFDNGLQVIYWITSNKKHSHTYESISHGFQDIHHFANFQKYQSFPWFLCNNFFPTYGTIK